MWESRRKNGRKPSRVFQPAVDGRLEDRVLLSSAKAQSDIHKQLSMRAPCSSTRTRGTPFWPRNHRSLRTTRPHFKGLGHVRKRAGVIGVQTARGGQAVEVTATDGSHYMVKLSYTSNTLATNTAEGQVGQAGATSPTTATRAGRVAIRKLSAADRHSPGLPHVGRTGGYHRRRIYFQYRSHHQSAGRTSKEGLCPQLRVR